jgi:ABC-2 type transport system ATP-binding protein
MQTIIETKKLTKYYGKTRGVENLDLKIKEGEIFGFLGPNGAGKTTTIRLLLRLINPTSGKAFIFGQEVRASYIKVLGDIGYLPGDLSLYDKMTGKQLLKFAGSFYRNDFKKFQKEAAERLRCELNTPFKKLSSGNKQKIGVLLAIFHKPKLLILDEPTSGLDPLSQNDFYKILFDLKKMGTTIFFSSHNLPEVEKICDRIGIIKEGNLVDVETIEEVRSHRRKEVEIHFDGSYKKEDFSQIEGIEILEAREDYLHMLAKNSAIMPILKLLNNYKIKDIDFSYPDLEEVFLKYYEN